MKLMRRCSPAIVVLFLLLLTASWSAPMRPLVLTESGGQTDTSDLTIDDTTGVVVASTSIETPRLDGTDAVAGDTAGEDLLIAAGQGTGSADSGDIEFEVAITDEGTSTTLKTREAVARFEGLTGWLSLLKPLEFLEEGSTPGTNPSTDSWLLYFQSDGLYYLDDAGVEIGPLIDSGSAGATDHGALTGLSDDDHPQYLLADGTRSLSADWDAGAHEIRAETFTSDVATGTAPLTVSSTTVVSNLNADLLDGEEGSYYLDSANFTGTDWTDLTDSGTTTLHTHDHGGLGGLTDDDHTQYALLAGRSGGQTLYGGTASGNNLTLESTSDATKGIVSIPDSTLVLEGSTPLRIIENSGTAFAQFSILSGALRIIGGSGLTDLNFASLDTEVAYLTSGSGVVATTGNINAQAGALQTGGTTRISSTGAGTLTSLTVDQVVADNNDITLGGASTTSQTILDLQGDSSDQKRLEFSEGTTARWTYFFINSAGGIGLYDEQGARQVWRIIQSAAFEVLIDLEVDGTLQVGNSSNTRWCKVNMLSGLVDSGTATLDASTSAIYWTFSASTSGAVFFQVPDSIVGSKIKQVRVYLSVASVTTPGTDIDITAYSSSSTTGALTSLGTVGYDADSPASTTVTLTLGSAYAHTAGTNMYILVGQDSTSGDAQTTITAIEVEFQEREY